MCKDYSTKHRNSVEDLVSDVSDCFDHYLVNVDARVFCGAAVKMPCGRAV